MREIAQISALALTAVILQGPCVARSVRRIDKVTLLPFAIAVQPLDGAPGRADQAAIVWRLTEAATARAERSLLQQGIAAGVERHSRVDASGVPITDAAARAAGRHSGDATEPLWVTGTVHLPVALPAALTGPRAWFHHGPFATAEVEVRQPAGEVIAREAATLDWREVRWFTGAGRLRHSRALDEVLVDFARKATDRAIKRLKGNEALFSAP